MTVELELTDDPDPEALAAIGEGLAAYNAGAVGPSGKRTLAIIAREAGTVAGGLWGYTAWGWLYIQWLWLAEGLRGQGLARRLLATAEDEALARGCHAAHIDTFNPAALAIYRRAGYSPFGTLEDFPPGHTRTFLQKRLIAP